MDYKVVSICDDGSLNDRYCATQTDVENYVVGELRMGLGPRRNKVTSITIFDLTED